MDFYIYDNITTYNNRFPYNGKGDTRLDVTNIYIPETKAFWFTTEQHKEETNINFHKRYLHLHPGMPVVKGMQFDKEPHHALQTEIKYNPKSKCIEIVKAKSFFRKEIIFKKVGTYYGSDLPKKPLIVLGNIFYDDSLKQIHFILSYYPSRKGLKFHFEEDEGPTMEQRMKVELLEDQIKEVEEKINQQSNL